MRALASATPRLERERAVASVLARHAAAADRVKTWEGGRALLTPALPDLWDANHLILDRPVDLDARGLAQLAGRILADGGARHRAVVAPDEREARRLTPGFVDLGWDRDRLLLMALRGTPRPRPGGPGAREVAPSELVDLRREMVLLEPWGSRGVAAQLEEHQRRLRAAFHSRCFAAPAGGAPRSSCELFSAEGVAEVADVGTLPEHRRRGLARAAIVTAVRAARAAGAELVIVTADADDWPRELYARLGFEPVGVIERFRRVGLEG